MRDGEVGLQPHRTLGRQRVRDLGGGLARRGGKCLVTVKQHLEEHLGVEDEGSRIEGHGLTVVDEGIGTSDGVRRQQTDELGGGEAGVLHAGEDFVDGILGLGDEAESGRVRCVRAASHELKARSTWAVGNTHRTGELDQVARGNGELLKKGPQVVDSIVDTVVGG